jgi:polyphosphate kinase
MPEPRTPHEDVFSVLRARDMLLHHPFESFQLVVEFLRQAARDPDVVAIKQTVYRTGPQSELMEILLAAARSGKEVTVVVELLARFDEEANIPWAQRLEEAGAHIVYGVVGYKTHAKMLMVVRREEGRLRRYVHLSTGNYHTQTTKLYTDFGLLTAHEEIGSDVNEVFIQLTGLGKASKLSGKRASTL